MEDNKFWYGIWKIVGMCFCVLVLSGSGCTMYQTNTLQQMVDKGADPIKATCSVFGAGDSNKSMCAIAATKTN